MQQPLTPFQHIPPCGLEIAGVPRVGHIAGALGVFHQEVHLVLEVPATDAMHIAEIGLIHADQEVVFLVIIVLELPGGLAGAVDPMLRQLAPCRGIDRIADLLGAGRRGLNVDCLLYTSPSPRDS